MDLVKLRVYFRLFITNPYVQMLLLIILLLVIYAIYKYASRYTSVRDLPRNVKNLQLKGIVTAVSDGDGFKLFHVPFLRSAMYTRSSPKLPVRLAGIDAPETRLFGSPAQPFSKEAKEFLSSLVLNRMVHITVLSIDMYNRLVAVVYVKTGWLSWINVNLEMVKAGLACVYDRAGAEYGGFKETFEEAERIAKKGKKGMWSNKKVVLPMDYKKQRK